MLKNNYPGKFIVFEGLDGSGQSTQAGLLRKFLEEQGFEIVLTKEPTQDSDSGKKIKEVLEQKIGVAPSELQELFAKDRKEHLENLVIPALKAGKTVISDRYFFSSFAYGSSSGLALNWLIQLNDEFLLPDMTFLLEASPEVCVRRIEERGSRKTIFEKQEKLAKVWEVYKTLPSCFGNVYMVDGEKAIEGVFSAVKSLVRLKILKSEVEKGGDMPTYKTTLLGCIEDAQTIAVAAALGCFEERSSAEILEELKALPEEERRKKEKAVLKNSFGRGHGSVGDQIHFTFSVENLPRLATFFLCLPEYLEHLQQSLRRAKASRGFFLPKTISDSKLAKRAKDALSRTFDFYERAVGSGIPAEDARFLLPLYTKTSITTTGNSRELCHLAKMAHRPKVPKIAADVADGMISLAASKAPFLFENFGFNYEPLSFYPACQLFSPGNETINRLIEAHRGIEVLNWSAPFAIDPQQLEWAIREGNEAELANLKHVHFEFLVPMSLACFHQAVRQRTWNHSVESIYDAVEDGWSSFRDRMVVPPSIKNSGFASEYEAVHLSLLMLYKELIREGISSQDAIGVIPHSLKVYDWVHINGWNAIHSIGKRTCTEAQWEIRLIARKIAVLIKEAVPAFKEWAEPQCITYGRCPEISDCGYYKKKKTN